MNLLVTVLAGSFLQTMRRLITLNEETSLLVTLRSFHRTEDALKFDRRVDIFDGVWDDVEVRGLAGVI